MNKNFVANKLYAGIQKYNTNLDIEKAWTLSNMLVELGESSINESWFVAATKEVYSELSDSEATKLAKHLLPLALPKRSFAKLYNSYAERQKREQL